eukprot:3572482-Prymnesium_polylepis.1
MRLYERTTRRAPGPCSPDKTLEPPAGSGAVPATPHRRQIGRAVSGLRLRVRIAIDRKQENSKHVGAYIALQTFIGVPLAQRETERRVCGHPARRPAPSPAVWRSRRADDRKIVSPINTDLLLSMARCTSTLRPGPRVRCHDPLRYPLFDTAHRPPRRPRAP